MSTSDRTKDFSARYATQAGDWRLLVFRGKARLLEVSKVQFANGVAQFCWQGGEVDGDLLVARLQQVDEAVFVPVTRLQRVRAEVTLMDELPEFRQVAVAVPEKAMAVTASILPFSLSHNWAVLDLACQAPAEILKVERSKTLSSELGPTCSTLGAGTSMKVVWRWR